MSVEYTKEELTNLGKKEKIVYRVTNLINGKIYIGQTIRTFNKRYGGAGIGAERMKGYYEIPGNGKNPHLYNSLVKYGTDNFKIDILCQCKTVEELNREEEYYIDLYDSTNQEKGYNKQKGGDNRRRAFDWRIERLLDGSDLDFFTKLTSNKQIEEDKLLELLNTRVVYIAKNGSSKKYYAYNNIRVCCLKNKISVEDGFCMAMRKRDDKNKKTYHHVAITKHEIWFRDDIEIDIKKFEGFKKRKLKGKRKNKNKTEEKKNKQPKKERKQKKTKEKKSKQKTKNYRECPCCGKTIPSRIRLCADCKRKREEERKIKRLHKNDKKSFQESLEES